MQVTAPCLMMSRCQLVFPPASRAWLSLAMFLLQFLVPLLVTMAAYTAISHHLWGTANIGAATHQQQVATLHRCAFDLWFR